MRPLLAFVLLLACRPDAKPVTPTAPATGGDFVAAQSDAPPLQDRAWRDALRGDRQAIRIPDHAPMRGAKEPLVTIVQFGDYTDPASAIQASAVADALQKWPSDVSVAFVQLPSRSRRVARMAAETATAAGAEKFWQVHDRLFATPPKAPADLERIATESGLDVATWKQAIESGLHKPWIEANATSARELGIVRAPALFVNGRAATGTADEIVAAIDAERTAMAKLVADGLPRAEIYAEILAVADMPKPLATPTGDDDGASFAVPAAERPVLGPANALVTIVIFSDFQCPYCARAQETLAELRKRHPDDVRLVFRNMPLAFHREARTLAKIALAAEKQGKFWEMHDLIFANRDLHTASAKQLAKKLRIDAKKLAKAMKSPELEQKIAEDEALAKSFGVSGTPTFFVNGRRMSGAQPIESFDALVREELEKAKDFAVHDPGGEGTVYDRMIEGFLPGSGISP